MPNTEHPRPPFDTPKDDPLPQETVKSTKVLLVFGIGIVGLCIWSLMQGNKTVSTEIQTAQIQSAQIAGAEPIPPTIKQEEPLAERDPQKIQSKLALYDLIPKVNQKIDDLVEVRAAYFRSNGYELSKRTPTPYDVYLDSQLARINNELAKLVKANQTTLTGTPEQMQIAAPLLLDLQAVSREKLRYSADTKAINDVPDELQSLLKTTSASPYLQLAEIARDADTLGYLSKLQIATDREAELKRIAVTESQRVQPKPQVGLLKR